jgi:hypothetical protein
MKYVNVVGILACCLLIMACYLPWTYYPDLGENFTGFFSEGNAYGKPGAVFLTLSLLAIVFFVLPRLWAKRINILIGALIVAYSIKTYILFTSCYRGDCPVKRLGIFLVLVLPILILIATVLPDLKLKEDKS